MNTRLLLPISYLGEKTAPFIIYKPIKAGLKIIFGEKSAQKVADALNVISCYSFPAVGFYSAASCIQNDSTSYTAKTANAIAGICGLLYGHEKHRQTKINLQKDELIKSMMTQLNFCSKLSSLLSLENTYDVFNHTTLPISKAPDVEKVVTEAKDVVKGDIQSSTDAQEFSSDIKNEDVSYFDILGLITIRKSDDRIKIVDAAVEMMPHIDPVVEEIGGNQQDLQQDLI